MDWRNLWLAAALFAAVATPAAAERVDDKYWLNGGAFFTSVNSKIRVDNNNFDIPGSVVDLESVLGLEDSKTVPFVLAGLRFANRWRVEFEFFELSRSGSLTLAQDITIDDVVYQAAANIATSFSSDTYRLVIGYSFVKNDNWELGATLGAHITNFDLGLVGTASVNGNAQAVVSTFKTQLAPLPTLGFYGNYKFSQMFSTYARIDFFALKIGDYSGRLIDAQAGVQARVIRNVGLGVGYRYVDYLLKFDKEDWAGRIEYTFHGPIIFAELAF